MKPKTIASAILMLIHLTWGCQVYRPIEKATILSDPALSKIDNISRQLAQLEEGDRISIIMANEVSHDLIFLAVEGDTLRAKLQKPKTSAPLKIPISRVKEVKVEQVSVAMTLVMSAAAAGIVAILINSAMSNFRVF